MFAKYKQRKAELEKERLLVESVNGDAKKLIKKLESLTRTIEAYQKQGALLLLEDLDEDLIKKLQSFTEDNVIIIFCKDGTRMELRKDEVKYNRNEGRIR